MDTLIHSYQSNQVDEDNPNPNLITNTQMESDLYGVTDAQMELDHSEKTLVGSDPNKEGATNTQMDSDPVEKTQMVSDLFSDKIMNIQMGSDLGEKTKKESDLNDNGVTNTQMESDPVEKTQMVTDPVHNQLTETQLVSSPVQNLVANTKMGSDPVEKAQMEIDPVDEQTKNSMAAESAVPEAVEGVRMGPQAKTNPGAHSESELMVVEQGENVGGETLTKVESLGSEEVSTDSISEDEQNPESSDKKSVGNGEDESSDQNPPKKQKSLSQMEMVTTTPVTNNSVVSSGGSKKKSSKKKSKNNNVWTKPTSRKGKKKAKNNNQSTPKTPQDMVYVAPIPRFPDRNDDSPDVKICLSKFYKAEKVEISEDRLSASSCKGYRMVRATRGVTEGPWYFEIKVVYLGETGHTRLGWSNEKGDLQAPVGYDGNSFGYRDIDGSKIHKALREKYGEAGYKEGDVIGFYINLPNGNLYAPKPAHMVWYKGQKFAYAPDTKNDPQIVPGSEISFFKNGVCQGVAYKDLNGGCYYPAASMYTLPNQPNCTVKFNFGPDFDFFPIDFQGRPTPNPMIDVPYHGFDYGVVDEMKV